MALKRLRWKMRVTSGLIRQPNPLTIANRIRWHSPCGSGSIGRVAAFDHGHIATFFVSPNLADPEIPGLARLGLHKENRNPGWMIVRGIQEYRGNREDVTVTSDKTCACFNLRQVS